MSELTREQVIDVLARMMRDEAYPEFTHAPVPEWAERAATRVIDYHQPMLRDELLRPYRLLLRRAARWFQYLDMPTFDDTEVWIVQAQNIDPDLFSAEGGRDE